MTEQEPTIRVDVDLTNPGQFFGCCGLLELADRQWPGAMGWFDDQSFGIACSGDLSQLIATLAQVGLVQCDPADNTASPIHLAHPFNLRLDWWLDTRSGGRDLKVWAGTMESMRIARAMQLAMRQPAFQTPTLFNVGMIAYDVENPDKKVEPYYFDARRGPNAHSRDVGFSPNDLHLTTTAFPAVELLCLIGLQRALPAPTDRPRTFDYHTWRQPLPPELVPAAVSGLLPGLAPRRFRFENWYRTGQRKHKAFIPATPISEVIHE